jgi:hypothetical protein
MISNQTHRSTALPASKRTANDTPQEHDNHDWDEPKPQTTEQRDDGDTMTGDDDTKWVTAQESTIHIGKSQRDERSAKGKVSTQEPNQRVEIENICC